jgi:hypothetical protein
LEGGLQEDFDPYEYRLLASSVDVDPTGRIIVGASVQAPAGTVIDLDRDRA